MSLDRTLGQVLPSDAFPKASFDAIEFAYTDITIKGGIRYAIHEFPHAAGGEPEKMGRKPYMISIRALMQSIPGSDLEREYPDGYPTNVRVLREKFEVQLTGDLVVPTVGKIRAVAVDWTQRFDVRAPSGEAFDLEFLEDQESSFLVNGISAATGGSVAMAEANDALLAAAAKADALKGPTQSIFQDINDAITAVQGAIDQGDAYARLVEGKLQAVVNLCAYADSQIEDLQNPANHLLVAALKDVWLASVELAGNVVETNQTLLTYTTPKLMTIGQVSAAIYGTSERGGEILQLNTVDDAFAIPAGKALKYVSNARGLGA